ncbi:MAG TPA: class I SAM-dependent methyltransferase, partial [Daejeonella sp.]|nr:class I SAM-dependent methyltransferase [Daejeonella sp.]
SGDYYTSSSLGPVFGALLARQLEEMWQLLGRQDFTIVEYGAGMGYLCHDILDHVKKKPEFYEQLRYCIIEKSESMRQTEHLHLPSDKVHWLDSIQEIKGFQGCVLSNELLDNFAVHQVFMQQELMEVFVDYQGGFTEVLKPASAALNQYFSDLNVQLPEGFRTEINLEAITWIRDIANSLQKGYVLTIDYGYPSAQMYQQSHSQGTLTCYHQHQINFDPYQHIGRQDITAHVNFSALCHYGLLNGLSCLGLTNQAGFLLALGFKNYFREEKQTPENLLLQAQTENFLTHTLLVDMGSKYKVLVQGKGVPQKVLMGLKIV